MWATDILRCSPNRNGSRRSLAELVSGFASVLAIGVWILRASLLATGATCAIAFGQPPEPAAPYETDSNIEPQVTDADVERARLRNPPPTDAQLARVPIPGAVNVDALPKASERAARAVNFSDVARGYEAVRKATESPFMPRDTAALIVFISFSMPQPTLERLVVQAQASRATLVLRGLVNGSLRETVSRCQTLIGQRQVAIQIDPQAFDRYAVAQVPTIVLVTSGGPMDASRNEPGTAPGASSCAGVGCGDAPGFISVHGDVSLAYALRAMAARDPRFELPAKALLRRLPGQAP